MTVGSKFNLFKEEIGQAMSNSRIMMGYDKNNLPVFEDATKEECIKRVMFLVDYMAHECIQAYSSSRALEILLKEVAGENVIQEKFHRYMDIAEAESKKFDDYDYEAPEEMDEKKTGAPFRVIEGGRK